MIVKPSLRDREKNLRDRGTSRYDVKTLGQDGTFRGKCPFIQRRVEEGMENGMNTKEKERKRTKRAYPGQFDNPNLR